jgi:hypothetical protein
MKIERLNDPSVLNAPKAEPRPVSALAQRRQRQYEDFRELLRQLTDEETVFQLTLDPDDKPITVRQRLQRVAAEAGVEIAVRKHANGFAVGRMTPERRSNRGRPRKSSSE